jgi:hypothetical protein
MPSVEMLLDDDWVELADAAVQDIGSGVYRVSFSLTPPMPKRTRAYDNQRLRLYRRREAIQVVGEQVTDGHVVVIARL